MPNIRTLTEQEALASGLFTADDIARAKAEPTGALGTVDDRHYFIHKDFQDVKVVQGATVEIADQMGEGNNFGRPMRRRDD